MLRNATSNTGKMLRNETFSDAGVGGEDLFSLREGIRLAATRLPLQRLLVSGLTMVHFQPYISLLM
jgi:hypothetical protein